ncbi:hypothetical protein EHS13_24115 [Paenibacillus psychroresistens]|uniref:Extracellular solute-binding protein n=1 Tax=Paenibacillus psychroresistens TaxID=1778678 RepID=A0A6B8RN26_9BACL|nr:hypothetical protein [Paenibacillus psychroresistens]QGQ97751.1 hypothetical protein EHS13_24115 [Paenibacillus psychroresistens]
MKKTLAILMASALVLLSACSSKSDNSTATSTPAATAQESSAASAAPAEQADPYAPMKDTVTITIAKEAAAAPKLGKGSTVEDNDLTKYISKKLNIKYVDAWQATNVQDAYRQKVSIALASNEIPDTLVVDKQQLVQMVNAGLLEDLTAAYTNYASPDLKASYDSTGGYSLKSATFDGKLMGIPNVSPGADGVNLLWLRQDWMDELGLKGPQTLDDINAIIETFKSKKGALGLLGNSGQIVNVGGNSIYGFDSIFSSFGAFPQLWYKNDQGEVVYGSVQPEVKTALAKLSEMYKAGLIDKEFAIKKTQQSDEAVASGKAGVLFGPWWISYLFGDSMKQDPKANWVPYAAPIGKDGKMNTHMMAPSVNYLVVKKGFKNPEAVVKTVNVQHDIDQMNLDQMKKDGIIVNDPEYQWQLMPFSILLSNYDDKEKKAIAVQSVIDGKTTADTLKGESVQIYQAYVNEKANPKKDFYAWAQKTANLDGASKLEGDNITKKIGVFYDQTDTMRTKWVNLKKLEDEAYLKIILGSASVDTFDTFVSKWKQQGGDQITKEVIEATQK